MTQLTAVGVVGVLIVACVIAEPPSYGTTSGGSFDINSISSYLDDDGSTVKDFSPSAKGTSSSYSFTNVHGSPDAYKAPASKPSYASVAPSTGSSSVVGASYQSAPSSHPSLQALYKASAAKGYQSEGSSYSGSSGSGSYRPGSHSPAPLHGAASSSFSGTHGPIAAAYAGHSFGGHGSSSSPSFGGSSSSPSFGGSSSSQGFGGHGATSPSFGPLGSPSSPSFGSHGLSSGPSYSSHGAGPSYSSHGSSSASLGLGSSGHGGHPAYAQSSFAGSSPYSHPGASAYSHPSSLGHPGFSSSSSFGHSSSPHYSSGAGGPSHGGSAYSSGLSYSGGPSSPSYSGGPSSPSYSGGPSSPSYSGGPSSPSYSGGHGGPSYLGSSGPHGGPSYEGFAGHSPYSFKGYRGGAGSSPAGYKGSPSGQDYKGYSPNRFRRFPQRPAPARSPYGAPSEYSPVYGRPPAHHPYRQSFKASPSVSFFEDSTML